MTIEHHADAILRAAGMTLTIETLAEAIHNGRSGIPWKATSQQDLSFRDARSVLTAIEQAGCVIVPMEATPEMQSKLQDVFDRYEIFTADAAGVWAALLSAAPKIQHSEGE